MSKCYVLLLKATDKITVGTALPIQWKILGPKFQPSGALNIEDKQTMITDHVGIHQLLFFSFIFLNSNDHMRQI